MKQICTKMLMLTIVLMSAVTSYSQEERNKPIQVIINDIKAAMDAGKNVVVVTTD